MKDQELKEFMQTGMVRRALDVQDACNLSGVVHAFSATVSHLWEYAHEHGKGTDWVNNHPLCVLYSNKIAILCGDWDLGDRFSWAYQWANDYWNTFAPSNRTAHKVIPGLDYDPAPHPGRT